MDQVTIYGRTSCGFCVRAMQLCDMNKLPYRFIDMVREGISKADVAETIGKPVNTVPQILVGEEHIGGFDNFSAYLNKAGVAAN